MPTSAGNALAKVDVSGGEGVKMWFEPGCLPGEPLMVPRPHGKEEGGEGPKEDDGVVLSLVIGADGGSFLLILDAESMDEVARAELGAGLPYGFHCCWVKTRRGRGGDFLKEKNEKTKKKTRVHKSTFFRSSWHRVPGRRRVVSRPPATARTSSGSCGEIGGCDI